MKSSVKKFGGSGGSSSLGPATTTVATAGEARKGYHQNHGGAGGAVSTQERRCDSCKYKTPLNQCTTFRCKDCGTYIICDYCYEDYMDKGGYFDNAHSETNYSSQKKIQCVYCWSRHTLTDICVKTLKTLGFMPQKGGNKISIASLTKEKIKKLSNLRVIQKTLVYVIGIAPEIASEEKLKSVEYFGQYGNLTKVVVNTNNVYNATRGGPSYSAYLTFNSPRESAIAILSVDQFVLNDRMIRASFGTSKFCQFFLNGQRCSNKDCLYLHELRADLEAYTKEDMQNNKFIFLEQQKIAIKLSKALELTMEQFKQYNIDRNEVLKKGIEKHQKAKTTMKPLLPEGERIYYKDFHFLDEPLIERQNKKKDTSNGETQGKTTSDTVKTKAVDKGEIKTEDQKIIPIFSNQKDESNQDRKLSKLRVLNGNQSAKNSSQADSTRNSIPSTGSTSGVGPTSNGTGKEVSGDGKKAESPVKNLFTFEPFKNSLNDSHKERKDITVVSSKTAATGANASGATKEKDSSQLQNGSLTKETVEKQITSLGSGLGQPTKSNKEDTSKLQHFKKSSAAGGASGPSEDQSTTVKGVFDDSDAGGRYGRKPAKKKKKIIVESLSEAPQPSSAQVVSQSVEQANIKKIDSSILATNISPLKIGTKAQELQQPKETEEKKTGIEKSAGMAAGGVSKVGAKQFERSNDGTNSAVVSLMKNQPQTQAAMQPDLSNQVATRGINHQSEGGTQSASTKELPKKAESQTLIAGTTQSQTNSGSASGNKQSQLAFMSPWNFNRNCSRFQFAHSLDPVKKDQQHFTRLLSQLSGGINGGGPESDGVDKDEILVPRAVQELIHRSIRTLSNSESNHRSPTDNERDFRSLSNSLNPVAEIEELEQKWYTLEEQAREQIMDGKLEEQKEHVQGNQTNPFRTLHKKEKDKEYQVANNLDVKRVKYSQQSPTDDKTSPEESSKDEYQRQVNTTHMTAPFQSNSGKEALRTKGGRRAPGAGYAHGERARQPPNLR